MTKTCTGCNETKPIEEFYRDSRTRDGHCSRCIPCKRSSQQEWYKRNPERRRQVDRAKYERNRKAIIARQMAYDRKKRLVNPEEVRAYRAAYAKEYRKANILRAKDYELRQNHNITIEDYMHFLDAQAGLCAICGQPPADGKFLSIDHCHDSQRIRGLLCRKCNLAIGNLQDDPVIAMNAALYLERTS